MRHLAIAALLAASCTRVAVMAPDQGAQDVGVATALRHTRLMVEGCTAEDVGRGWVLTAKHCTHDLPIGEDFSVGTLIYQGKEDYAILFDAEQIDHASACLRAPQLGEHVYAVGYPVQRATREQALTVTDGVISTVAPTDEGEIRTSAPLFFGNSGGGLWAEDGCLVGITVAAFMDTAENYIVSVESLPKFLD